MNSAQDEGFGGSCEHNLQDCIAIARASRIRMGWSGNEKTLRVQKKMEATSWIISVLGIDPGDKVNPRNTSTRGTSALDAAWDAGQSAGHGLGLGAKLLR